MNLADLKIQDAVNAAAPKTPQYQFGKGTYANGKLDIFPQEGKTLRVGAYCSFAGGVKIFLGGEHRTDWVTTFPFNVLWDQAKSIPGHPASKGDVIIGNDVWVGDGALILSGVNIGDGAVIGARSVVTRDVPPYCIVAGNPAKFIKKRFDDDVIERLLRVKWWRWNEDEIVKALPLMLSDNIEAFLDYAEKKLSL